MFISLKKHFLSAKFFSFYIKKFPAFHIKCAGNSLYCFIIEKHLFFYEFNFKSCYHTLSISRCQQNALM